MGAPEKTFSKAEQARTGSRYDRALELYRQALRQFTAAGDLEGIVDCHVAMGDTLRMIGEFPTAIGHYTEALELAEEKLVMADAQAGIGLSHRALGDWKEALHHLELADDFYRKNRDRAGHAFTTWAIAGTYRIKGDLTKTLSTFREALDLYREMKDRRGMGYCYNGLGGASRVAGRFKDSEKYYKRANQVFRELKDRF
ncbi:MAG: tetratricopeptide repeat protein, partial [Thermodesulfobacteriota bacterium]